MYFVCDSWGEVTLDTLFKHWETRRGGVMVEEGKVVIKDLRFRGQGQGLEV